MLAVGHKVRLSLPVLPQMGFCCLAAYPSRMSLLRDCMLLAWGRGHVACHYTLDASPVATEMGLQGCSGVPPTSLPP